jgi:hypothetical protein
MPMPSRDVRRMLMNKFDFEEVKGSKHDAVAFVFEGKKIATTRFSRAARDIGDSILKQMAKQVWART